jgi:putative two-component system response regulator
MLDKAAVIALNHHERWDGNGYPAGLKHEQIPLEGRMLSIVDVFDALTTERPYKKAWSVDEAVKYIREAIGSQFDPKTTLIFLDNLQEFIEIKQKYSDQPDAKIESALT